MASDKKCCCCIPLRAAVILLSVLTLAVGLAGVYLGWIMRAESSLPSSFTIQTLLWWLYAVIIILLILSSICGLIGAVAKHVSSILLYYYILEGIVAVQLGYFLIIAALALFNLGSYCDQLNFRWHSLVAFFYQHDVEVEMHEDFTLPECRNVAIISLVAQIVCTFVCFYFASCIHSYAQELVSRQTQTRRAINVVRYERDLDNVQTKV